jgi:hypothetical protein
MQYQIIRPDNRIANSTAFGRRLRRLLRQAEQRQLLPMDGNWRLSGAWILADALSHWSRGNLAISALRSLEGGIEHVVAQEKGLGAFVDADGVAGSLELMTKMAVIMRRPHVALTDFSPAEARNCGLHYDQNTAIQVTVRLLRHFGDYRRELLALPSRPAHRLQRLLPATA